MFAVPGLLLAGFGIAHPAVLDAATASWWTTLHVVLLPVFPLLAVAQWQMLSSAPSWLRIPGRVAAYGFATFYGGLDAVAGIAAGAVADAQHAVTPVIGAVFAIGDLLGHVGAACFLAANVVIVIAATLPLYVERSAITYIDRVCISKAAPLIQRDCGFHTSHDISDWA